MSETPRDPNHAPLLSKLGLRPPGSLPKNIQAWSIGGLSVLMAGVIGFSGRTTPKDRPAPQVPAITAPTDPSKDRIRQYQAQLEEEVRRLQEEQAKLVQVKQAAEPAVERISYGSTQPYYQPPVERDPLKEAREKREYESLYASNEVQVRGQRESETPRPLESSTQTGVPPMNSNTTALLLPPAASAQLPRLFPVHEGTIIETALQNRLDGEFSGPVKCLVTTPVYSKDRMHLLIPEGSVVLGLAQKVEGLGQSRLAVVFHRMILPNGSSVNLEQFRGLNQVGETGLRDQVNRHYLQIFGASLAIGSLAGLNQFNTQYGFNASAEDVYRRGVTSSVSQSALRILDRFLDVLPTITIREGQRVKVYLTGDLMLPEYQEPAVPVL